MMTQNTAAFYEKDRYAFPEHKNRDDIRDYKRYKCDISIICNWFNKADNFYAKMRNYNKKGMYFESSLYFKKGSSLFFRIQDYIGTSESEYCEGLRTASLAEVIWCEKKGDKNSCFFGTGVKYYAYY